MPVRLSAVASQQIDLTANAGTTHRPLLRLPNTMVWVLSETFCDRYKCITRLLEGFDSVRQHLLYRGLWRVEGDINVGIHAHQKGKYARWTSCCNDNTVFICLLTAVVYSSFCCCTLMPGIASPELDNVNQSTNSPTGDFGGKATHSTSQVTTVSFRLAATSSTLLLNSPYAAIPKVSRTTSKTRHGHEHSRGRM